MKRNYSGKAKRSFPSIIADIFVVAILFGQLLVFQNYYFNILDTKYYYYCGCSILLIVLTGGYYVYRYARLEKRTAQKEQDRKRGVREWAKGLSKTDWMVIAFITVAAVSTVLSPYKFEAFWGNEGRFTGLFLMVLYTAVYFCITRNYEPKRWHIEAFLVAGMLMCLFGITDFFDMDILRFKAEMRPEQRYMFTSTIGNINTYTACVAMVMAVAGVLFAACSGAAENIWYGVCTVVALVALMMGESDNAYLSLAAFYGLLPLYLFRSRKGVRKYVVLLAMFFSSVLGIATILRVFGDHGVQLEGLFHILAGFSGLPVVVVALWLIVAALYGAEYLPRLAGAEKTAGKKPERVAGKKPEQTVGKKPERAAGRKPGQIAGKGPEEAVGKKPEKTAGKGKKGASGRQKQPAAPKPVYERDLPRWLTYAWWGVIAAVAAALVFVLYDVNVAGHVDRYGVLKGYLLFNDDWGTQRGFVWRLTVENYLNFKPLQKIFGYGPDTLAIVLYQNNMQEMVMTYNQRYDNAHNEFLHYFVTIGPMGLAAYVGIMATTVWSTVKEKLANPLVIGAVLAVICYNFQALVNINQPIATPVMWMLLCFAMAKKWK